MASYSTSGSLAVALDEALRSLHVLITVTACLLGLCLVSGALRMYVRLRILRTMGNDDWAMIIAQCCFTPLATMVLWFSIRGLHAVESESPISGSDSLIRFSQAAYALDIMTIVVAKVSLCLSMFRIFGEHHAWERAIIASITTISTVSGAVTLLLGLLFPCVITADQYGYDSIYDACTQFNSFILASIVFSAINIITDLTFAALAIIIIYRMTLAAMARCSAILLFVLGAVGTVTSGLRIAAWLRMSSGNQSGNSLTSPAIWAVLEAGTSLAAVCLFTLRPLFTNPSTPHPDRPGRKASLIATLSTRTGSFLSSRQGSKFSFSSSRTGSTAMSYGSFSSRQGSQSSLSLNKMDRQSSFSAGPLSPRKDSNVHRQPSGQRLLSTLLEEGRIADMQAYRLSDVPAEARRPRARTIESVEPGLPPVAHVRRGSAWSRHGSVSSKLHWPGQRERLGSSISIVGGAGSA